MTAVRIPHSFELYPPRSPATAAALPAVLDDLVASGPQWCSVTYGASGSTREASFDVVRMVHERGEVMAHVTCVGSSRADAAALVRRFLDLGVHRFLAIRGDRIDGGPRGDFGSAAELVQLVHQVQAERVPALQGTPGVHRAGTPVDDDGDGARASVAVAAFVNGHPESRTPEAHLDALLAKQVAGADLAITQLFFFADDYAAFVERARRWGITIPIVPGIMPVTGPGRLRRMLELSGEAEPAELAAALDREPTAEGRREIGVAHAVRLAEGLIAAGAPSLHLCTFNQPGPALEVLGRLGLADPPHRSEETP